MKWLNAIVMTTFFTALFSSQLLAAQFSPVSKLSSPAAQKLAQVSAKVVKNQEAFGDNGLVAAYTFTRKSTEADLSTVKQLSYKFGANSDDFQKDFQNTAVKDITEFAFYAFADQEGEFEQEFKTAKAELSAALKAIKADKTLRLYGNQHADEDGSWNILFVFDSQTNQVLVVKIGYSGT